MSEWESVYRLETIFSFTFQASTRPLLRSARTEMTGLRRMGKRGVTYTAAPPSEGLFRNCKRTRGLEPAFPSGERIFTKSMQKREISAVEASRFLNRFRELIREASRGKIILNEWSLMERETLDLICNSEGLKMQSTTTRITLAFQVSSPTGHVVTTIPLKRLGDGVPKPLIMEICRELTAKPSPPPPLGRYPAILSSHVTAAIVNRLLPLIRAGAPLSYTLPDGWTLMDDPSENALFYGTPFDAEGRATQPLVVWEGGSITPITDTLTARARGLRPTAHAVRPTLSRPPRPNYHGLILMPPGNVPLPLSPRWKGGLNLLRPVSVKMIEEEEMIQIVASGYTLEGERRTVYHPFITCRFKIKDLLRNLKAAITPPAFHLMECPIGAPDCHIGSLNVYS